MPDCEEDVLVEPSSLWFYVLVCGITPALLILTAFMAGLTHGFLSLDPTHLAVIKQSGTKLQQKMVATVEPLLHRHNWVLVSMVLVHAVADEALPIVLEQVVNKYLAVGLSVPLVLFFGEVLPSAVFAGPRQLQLTARFSWLAWVTSILTSVVTYPIGMLMDWWMGSHKAAPRNYHRHELRAFLKLHEGKRQTAAPTAAAPSLDSGFDNEAGELKMSLLDAGAESDGGSSSGSEVPAPMAFHSSLMPLWRDQGIINDIDHIVQHGGAVGAPGQHHEWMLAEGDGGGLQKQRSDSVETAVPEEADREHKASHTPIDINKSAQLQTPVGSPGITSHMHGQVSDHELGILEGALNLASTRVRNKMIPFGRIFMLSTEDEITPELLVKIADTAHNRVPVHAGDNRLKLVGVLLVKSLLRVMPRFPAVGLPATEAVDGVSSEASSTFRTIGDLPLIRPTILRPDMTMLDALHLFKAHKSHMAFVSEMPDALLRCIGSGQAAAPGLLLGLITMEDCLAAVLNSEHQLSDAHEMQLVRHASIPDVCQETTED